MQNKVLDLTYFMLPNKPWWKDVEFFYDWGINLVII
jgi:hypothetical protein